MKIQGSIALVTGANRGLGAAFARGLLAAGAAKVYAAARDPAAVTVPGVVPVRLDVTRPEHIAALARDLSDVTLLVNNAGIGEFGPLLAPGAIDSLQRQFETNAAGPLRLVQAFAPGPKIAPEDVVRQAIAALEAGHAELLADATTRKVHAGLAAEPPVYVGTGA